MGLGPQPPAPIRELTIHTARTMLDSHSGGAAAIMNALETGVQLDNEAGRLWRLVEMEYSAGRMGRLGLVASAGGRRR